MGLVKYTTKQLSEALVEIEYALSLSPANPLYHANLATVLNDLGELSRAEHHYQSSLKTAPDNAAAVNGLGIIARKQLKYNLAITYYRRAIELDANFATAHNNLANVLTLIGRFDEALSHTQTALEYEPTNADAWNNQGFAYTMLGEFDRANASLEQAIHLNPDLAVANFNLAANRLRDGNYLEGWDKYEWRLRLNGQNPHIDPRKIRLPSLTELKNSHILLIAEQGMGDFLQFVRFAKILYEQNIRITASCDERLIPLISHLPWFNELIPRDAKPPNCDYAIPMMSLARLLGITPENIPLETPYLGVPKRLTDSWRAKLPKDKNLLIGITWFGNPDNPVNILRSPPLENFSMLADIPGTRLVSLQTGPAVQDLLDRRERLNPLDLGTFEAQKTLTFSFPDTAAILLNLDVFITSCTVTAHLAGALGIPTWLVLSHVSDWRWGTTEVSSRWYPSVRLFRQQTSGDWPSAFAAVRLALEDLRDDARHLNVVRYSAK